jgi:serine/threonine protein kinase
MLTKSGVKVLDFGLAKMGGAVASGDRATDVGPILGTAHYMSPEQAQRMDIDFRSDIFSFGVAPYEMLTGSRPFEAASTAGVRAAILEAEPATLRDSFSVTLDRVIRSCLAKNVEDRWQSAQDLGFALAWRSLAGRSEPRPAANRKT